MLRQRRLLLLCVLVSFTCFANSAWIHVKALLAQVLIEQAWSEMLASGKPVRPWVWADFWPVARLQVKRSGKLLYVLSSASGASLAFGPGHVNGSAMPATEGTSFIAAHRDTHFKFLRTVSIGDEFIVQRHDGRSIKYSVKGTRIVDTRGSKLDLDMKRDALTLITCYPFDAVDPGGPLRLLVDLLPEQGVAGA